MNMLRHCNKHGLTEHVLDSSGRWRCKKCRVDTTNKRRMVMKHKAIEYKGGKCLICGYNKCEWALEFHHINPNEKDFNFSHDGFMKSIDKIKTELDKTILVCSNCHREIHCGLINVDEYVNKQHINEQAFDKEKHAKRYCKVCGKELNNDSKLYCSVECYRKDRKSKKPSYEELMKKIEELNYNFLALGRFYNVSDNAVRKWCDFYNIDWRKKKK